MEINDYKEEDVIDIPVGVQQIFDERHYRAIERNVRNSIPKLHRYAILAGAVIIMIVYFSLPVSRIRAVNIYDNHNLPDSYIQDLADVSESGIYYLTIPALVEYRLKSDPLIEDAKVRLGRDNAVIITVKEKTVLGYRYEDEPVLLMTDGSKVPLKSEYLEIISKIPMIAGFYEDNQTAKLCRAFEEVDPSLIRDISEISQYSLSYDPEAIRILMRAGGYFMGDYYNMSVFNAYWKMYNKQTDKSYCIVADDSLKTASSTICPWDLLYVEREYWTDEKGNIMTNTYGDKVEKHYYTLQDGSFALDESGKKIPIPVSLQGYEVPDENFYENYDKGYYKTGVLKIPDENDKKEAEKTEEPEKTDKPEKTEKPDKTEDPEKSPETDDAEKTAEPSQSPDTAETPAPETTEHEG